MNASTRMALSSSVRSLSSSSVSMTTYWSLAYSYPETICSPLTSPCTGHDFLYWIRLLQSACSWFSEMPPPPLEVVVNALTGTDTRLILRKPFHRERAAIGASGRTVTSVRGRSGLSPEIAGWAVSWDAVAPYPAHCEEG